MIEIDRKDCVLLVGFREMFCDNRYREDVPVITVEEGDGGAYVAVKGSGGQPIIEFHIAREDALRFSQAILLSSGAAVIKQSPANVENHS